MRLNKSEYFLIIRVPIPILHFKMKYWDVRKKVSVTPEVKPQENEYWMMKRIMNSQLCTKVMRSHHFGTQCFYWGVTLHAKQNPVLCQRRGSLILLPHEIGKKSVESTFGHTPLIESELTHQPCVRPHNQASHFFLVVWRNVVLREPRFSWVHNELLFKLTH